jgi:hypothetical protein
MGSTMEEITLQTLYEQQDYETLVKRTASLSDLNMIRYHVIGLLGIGANQMVLRVMLAKFSIIQKALVIFLKIHYEILKNHRQFQEHALLLEQYERIPYLSQEVEEWVSKLRILFQKPPHTTYKDTLEMFLDAYQQKNMDMLMDLIPQLKPIHLFSAKTQIKTLLTEPFPQRIKGMLVLALIDAKYDETIHITKGEKTLGFNPIDTVNPFQDGTFEHYQKQIDEMVKDPSVRQIGYSVLTTYMLTMIPFEIDPEYYFFKALVEIAYGYLKLNPPPLDETEEERTLIDQKKHHLEMILKM